MGVYIPNMQMPKFCGWCPFSTMTPSSELSLSPKMDAQCALGVDLNSGTLAALYDGSKKSCPLVEVKEPHGRLIEADKLKSIQSIQNADFNSIETIQKWIDDAPTVIEAEGEDE